MASEVADHPTPAKDGPLSGASGKPSPNGEGSAAAAAAPSVPTLDTHAAETPLFQDNDSDAGVNSDAFETPSPSRMLSPVTSPPYWLMNSSDNAHSNGNGHGSRLPNGHSRSVSVESVLPAGAITLQDNESSVLQGRDRNAACWARSVEVTDFIVINGSTTNIGAFVVWNIRVETLTGSYMNIRKRYSEFDEFRKRLVQTFPSFEAAVPALPPKSVISKFRSRFLEKRRAGLQYFLNCILLNPEFSGSPVLKDFLFS